MTPDGLREPLLFNARVPRSRLDSWLFRFVRGLIERQLALSDLSRFSHGQLDVAAADARLQARLARGEPLDRALFGCFRRQLAAAAACKLCADVLKYVPPLLLSRLLGCLHEDTAASAASAYGLALLLPLCTLAQAVLVNRYFWHALGLGVLARGALSIAICRRALQYRLRDAVDSGRLANLLSSDCGRINNVCGQLCMLWSAPLQLLLALSMLLLALGPAVLGGLAVLLALWPAQWLLSRKLARLRARTAAATDVRLDVTEAVVRCARALKLQRWEALCEEEARARAAER